MPLQAQVPRLNWRTVPDSAFFSNQVQIRLTHSGYLLLQQMGVAAAGKKEIGLPEIDSIWHYYGFQSFQFLTELRNKPTKVNLSPDETKVFRWVRFTLKEAKFLKPVLEALEQLPQWVEMAEPVYRTETHDMKGAPFFNDPWLPNDSLFNRQWHYHNTGQTNGLPDADIDLPEAWQIEKGHPSVVVAVLDNGLDTTHPELLPMLSPLRGYNFFAGNNFLIPGNHGNHVGGTIAARSNNITHVSGIAGGDGTNGSGARLVSCQIFGVPSGSGGIENAFVWSAQNGVAICNNSWGYVVAGTFNQSVLDAIDYFIENGGGIVLRKGLVIFSAGNSNDYAERWPAVYHKVIGVTATNHRDIKAWYSSFHEKMDIAAPGGELNEFSGGPVVDNGRRGILSTVTIAGGQTGFQQGTSMAAPHVSGVAALIASHGSGRLSADDVKSILLTQTDEIDSYQSGLHRGRLGEGRLNAHKSLILTNRLVQLPLVLPPVGLQAAPQCGNIKLSWQKNDPAAQVMVAVSNLKNRGGLFGVPQGNLQLGDSISGGGRVIYKGSESEFLFQHAVEGVEYFFKAWTVGPQSYSLGVVPVDFVTIQSPILQLEATADCFDKINLQWSFASDCQPMQVVIAYSNTNSFGNPSGTYLPGDSIGDAKVIYSGNEVSFTHLLANKIDSTTLFYQVWPVFNPGIYGNPKGAIGKTPAAIENAFVKNSLPTALYLEWKKNPCFTGEVLLAVNSRNQFGKPEGFLQPGDLLPSEGGQIIYRGPAAEFIHQNLPSSETFYYSIWPIFENNQYGFSKTFFARTACSEANFPLPFTDTLSPVSLLGCTFDTVGFRNFTAGPFPRLSVTEQGFQPKVLPASGKYMFSFNSFDTREGNQVWLTTPPLQSQGVDRVDVAFRWYEDGSDYNSAFFEKEGVTLVWSVDNIQWDTVMFFPRITRYGSDGWKYKQVTLPEKAGQQPRLFVRWVFNSRWGFNCFLDDPMVIPTHPKAYPVAFTKGVAQFTDPQGITHYYDSLQNLLLSMDTKGQDIGHVNEQLFLGSGGALGATNIASGSNYMLNPGGWAVGGKYWFIGNWVPPDQSVWVHNYVHPEEIQDLETLARSGSQPMLAPGDAFVRRVYTTNGVDLLQADPKNGHRGIPVTQEFGTNGFWQFDVGAQPDTVTYVTQKAFAEWKKDIYPVKVAGSGGMGAGSPKGNGALLPHWLSLKANRENKSTKIEWVTGYERYWRMMDIEVTGTDNSLFAHLAFMPPNGGPQHGAAYTFFDERVLPNGRYQYRIKATDFMGKILYSPVVELNIAEVKGLLLFPNPATTNELSIFSESPMLWLRIMDAKGSIVFAAAPGTTQYRGQLPVLAAGLYFVQAKLREGIVVKKLIIQP